MNADDINVLNAYIDKLEKVAGATITDLDSYLSALKSRHDYFAANGCKVSDHGLDYIYAADYTEQEIKTISVKLEANRQLHRGEFEI